MQVSPILDRFIPQRSYSNLEVASYNISHPEVESITDVSITQNWAEAETKQIFFNTAKYANNIINYRKLLGTAMGLTHSKILKCSIPEKTSKKYKAVCERKNTWPVHARKRPLISSPDVVLDMPDIDTTLHNNVIDWGKRGQIATIFQGEVHLWVASNSHLACTQTDKSVLECIKWNRKGTHFAVSRSRSRLSIIDAKTCKIERTYTCECLDCEITAIEWSSSGTVVSGCSYGSLMYVTKDYPRTFHFYKILKSHIVDLKFSCRDSFLLASTDTGFVAIYKWPIRFNGPEPIIASSALDGNKSFTVSTSWHPWKESILALGGIDNDVTIYNINALEIMDYRNIKPYFRENCFLDFLTFNPLTAELLVSFYWDRDTEEEFSFLTVFSDLDTRVDEMRFHVGRVPHALWDGTGTKLATIGADESLVIWNFFGKGTDTEKKMLAQRKKKTKNNIFEMSKRFHTCIR